MLMDNDFISSNSREVSDRMRGSGITGTGSGRHVWSVGIRLLHWLTVVVLAVQITVGFALMGGPGMATMRWLPFHMSLGVSILGVILIRIIWRVFEVAPTRRPSPAIRRLGSLVHVSLYVLIFAIVITGWFAYRPVPLTPPAHLFGRLPAPTAPRIEGVSARDFALIHRSLVYAFLALVGTHVAAALVHAFILRDGIPRAMLFGRQEPGTFGTRPDR
jgi:cytochrome b561